MWNRERRMCAHSRTLKKARSSSIVRNKLSILKMTFAWFIYPWNIIWCMPLYGVFRVFRPCAKNWIDWMCGVGSWNMEQANHSTINNITDYHHFDRLDWLHIEPSLILLLLLLIFSFHFCLYTVHKSCNHNHFAPPVLPSLSVFSPHDCEY